MEFCMRENEERWRELCAQAAREQDPRKLQELAEEINRLLMVKEERLATLRKSPGQQINQISE
jgi:hypothetical protein